MVRCCTRKQLDHLPAVARRIWQVIGLDRHYGHQHRAARRGERRWPTRHSSRYPGLAADLLIAAEDLYGNFISFVAVPAHFLGVKKHRLQDQSESVQNEPVSSAQAGPRSVDGGWRAERCGAGSAKAPRASCSP